jgi:dTDP-4-dehydrorhamnose 3,5-epimerase
VRVSPTALPDVLLVQPVTHRAARGHFLETFHAERYAQAGIPGPFVQDNLSFSHHGVLRGLHYQWPNPQGKLVFVLQGEIFDVAVDIRRQSPTFGRWVGVTLSADNHQQLWIPPGFAHGFCVTSAAALVTYKCTDYYAPECERAIRWDDAEIGIDWPLSSPVVSSKDGAAESLRMSSFLCRSP